MHKNLIAHSGSRGRLENTYPQDNSMDNYGDYYIGIRNYGYPQHYISKSNIGSYNTTVDGVTGTTMTLVRPMIEYKE